MSGSGHSRLLKILHIDPERNWGGGEAQVFGLLTYLAVQGHDNDLLGHPEGRLWARCQSLDVSTRAINIRNDLDLRCVPGVRRLIRSKQYDIVHLHTKRAHALSLWLPRFRNGPKYVVTRRMDYPEQRNSYTRCLYNRRVDGVVAISQTIKDSLICAGVDAGRIRLIYSGIDPGPYDRSRTTNTGPCNATVVGCLAALEARKGHCFLLDAAALLKARGLRLEYRFAGDGPLRADLEEYAVRLGIRDQVSFLGFVAEPAEFLADIDIFAMPSLYEGLGVSALEAMAAGKPVVATSVGGLTESVIDGVTGFIVRPQDSSTLAEAIAKLVQDRASAAEMGRQGRERVVQNFSLEQMARQNESYYYDLLGSAQ